MGITIPAKFVLRDGTIRRNENPLPVQRVLPRVANPKRTPPDHWLNLPRRKCDFCGKSFKPSQPIKKRQKYSFCCQDHKNAFHKRGGAFSKAAEQLKSEIKRQVKLYARCPCCHSRPRRKKCEDCEGFGYVLTEYGQHLKEFIEYTVHEKMREFENLMALSLSTIEKNQRRA
jgi:hypothetical protein